jgi:hypothetical protein
MGLDTHMIAGSRACSTSTPAHSPDHHQPDKPALCRGPAPSSRFHSRLRYPLDPPASAVMSSLPASGRRASPPCPTTARWSPRRTPRCRRRHRPRQTPGRHPRRRRRTGSPCPPWGRGSRGHRRGPAPPWAATRAPCWPGSLRPPSFGVDADHRLAGRKMRRGGLVHVAELGVSVGVLGPLVLLGRGLEAVAETGEQLADLGRAHPIAQARELRGQGPHALGRPAQRGGRVAPGGGLDQVVQGSQQAGVVVDELLSPSPRPAHPAAHWHSSVDLGRPLLDGRAAHPRHASHQGDPTTTQSPSLSTGQDPTLTLIQVGQDNSQPACHHLLLGGLHARRLPRRPLIDQVIHAQALTAGAYFRLPSITSRLVV